MRSPIQRRLIVATALICQVFATALAHPPTINRASPPVLDEALSTGLPNSKAVTLIVPLSSAAPPVAAKPGCHEEVVASLVDEDSQPSKQACCKDGTCKCATPAPAAVQTPAPAPAACSSSRPDANCQRPPSRLRPTIYFRPPI